jgi:hypothetical protein
MYYKINKIHYAGSSSFWMIFTFIKNHLFEGLVTLFAGSTFTAT